MEKKYFALFLDGEKYIEKCVSLIYYINNPTTSSFPHITVRFIYEAVTGNEYLSKAQINYLNIIKPGIFINNAQTSYTIFLQCESEDLEELEYKYDYPFSKLHITLYEGSDKAYADKLLSILNSINWKIKLNFTPSKNLVENIVGTKRKNVNFHSVIRECWKEILGNYDFEILFNNNFETKLEYIKRIIEKLSYYLESSENITRANSNYNVNYKALEKKYLLEAEKLINANPYKNSVRNKIHSNFITPPEYAKDMAESALEYFDFRYGIHFGDSSVGTGNLFLALKRAIDKSYQDANLASAIGIDIDESMVKEAFLKFNKRGLEVINGDALLIDYNSIKPRNLMLVNPPYNRYENFSNDYISLVNKIAEKYFGVPISKTADIFVYHLLIVDQWLADDGVAAWLLPSSFLHTKYARVVREYLTEKVTLLKLHIYDDNIRQFDKTDINTSLIVFKKKKPTTKHSINITLSQSFSQESKNINYYNIEFLVKNIDNWRNAIVNAKNNFDYSQYSILFCDLFEIKRGIATGANSFFVLTQQQADNYGIPFLATKPILPKARYLDTKVINCDKNGNPLLKQKLVLIDCDLEEYEIQRDYPDFYLYLQKAKEKDSLGKSIISRTLVKSRTPWYKQEYREPAPFLITYMGRPKKDNVPSLYFIRNKSNAVALNTYILLYPKQWLQELLNVQPKLYDEIFDSLNYSAQLISSQTRIYSGNLQKLEPGELKKLPILRLPPIVKEAFETKDLS